MIDIIAPYIGLVIVVATIVILWHLADKGNNHKSGKNNPRK